MTARKMFKLVSNILLLDYDQTFYPRGSVTLSELDRRITLFVSQNLKVEIEQADSIRQELCARYGTTLRGLRETYQVNHQEYYDFIHQVPTGSLPLVNKSLSEWFDQISIPIYVFTNARRDWVEMGLRAMGLEKYIRDIFDIESNAWRGKPEPQCYSDIEASLVKTHGKLSQIFFVDDHIHNLWPAYQLAWKTFWIRDQDSHKNIDLYTASSLSPLARLQSSTSIVPLLFSQLGYCHAENCLPRLFNPTLIDDLWDISISELQTGN